MCRNSISILFNRELSTFYFSDNLFSRLFGYLTHMLLWCISSAFCDCFSFSHVVMDASPADYVFGFIIDNWHMYLLGQGDWITNCMTSLLGRGPGWHLTHPNDWKKHGRSCGKCYEAKRPVVMFQAEVSGICLNFTISKRKCLRCKYFEETAKRYFLQYQKFNLELSMYDNFVKPIKSSIEL
ncbi:uncharacterized protein LOC132040032 isoform X2 [Lycium ferocissimum]|uniref:uncharacterized protein LOC132040032 isoform X2 n=1 Tax=Lycium ferocissimum TaxID=112874 RepID=UPI002814BB18|nr:uncharacterized protein LOC132040032 isoform X2 [Lycium ferocissimum]